MKLRPEEITSILRERIENFDVESNLAEVGAVLQVGDGIARVHGLENCVALEMLELEHGVDRPRVQPRGGQRRRRALRRVGARSRRASPSAAPARSPRCPSARRCSAASSTRSATRSTASARSSRPRRARVEWKAPGVIQRQPVKEPLQTGIKAIDSMTNVGRGQRELIIGDRSTGKTAIAIDTILNQHDQDVKCIYVAIGQKASTVAQVVERLREAGAMEYTTVVVARRRRGGADQVDGAVRRLRDGASTSSTRASTR